MIAVIGLCGCGCGQRTNVVTRRGPGRGAFRRFVRGHNQQTVRAGPVRDKEGYLLARAPEHPRASRGRVYEHIVVAERALGKHLPPAAQVHHVDGDRAHNEGRNLVVCQDAAYHNLLHQRLRALRACGNPNWLVCCFCHQYDNPSQMYVYARPGRRDAYHRACSNDKQRARKLARAQ